MGETIVLVTAEVTTTLVLAELKFLKLPNKVLKIGSLPNMNKYIVPKSAYNIRKRSVLITRVGARLAESTSMISTRKD